MKPGPVRRKRGGTREGQVALDFQGRLRGGYHMHEEDRHIVLPECLYEAGGIPDDFLRRVRVGGLRRDTLLQVNDHQGCCCFGDG